MAIAAAVDHSGRLLNTFSRGHDLDFVLFLSIVQHFSTSLFLVEIGVDF